MKLWIRLYALIWLAFLQFILVYVDVPGLVLQTPIHVFTGFVIIVLSLSNLMGLRNASSPARLVRISFATAAMAAALAVFGIGLRLELGPDLEAGVRFVHLVMALAVITQASSVATAYDMWEEREFDDVTAPV